VRHTLHNGFPIKQYFQSPRSDCLLRNLYDNHSSIDGYEGILGEKVATDVQNSFAFAFPRWILRFIHGLTLNAMGIDVKISNGKIKHRLINDPSTPVLGDDDHGNVNMQLDKRVPDDVPKVFYGDFNSRIWQRIYNLHLKSPDEEIILYKDDIVAAFRRGKYHPDIAVAYAYAFGSFLIIPIGGLFGPRDTPGWFCMTSELHAMASLHLPGMASASHPLTDACVFDTTVPTVTFAKDIACSQNTGDVFLQGPRHALLMTLSVQNISATFTLSQQPASWLQPSFTVSLLQSSIPSVSKNICHFFDITVILWESMSTAGPCLLFFRRIKEMPLQLHYVVSNGNVALTHPCASWQPSWVRFITLAKSFLSTNFCPFFSKKM